ncbi:MAG: TldD/PmbA family protein [Chloroflexi bacterium]|nr:TldD/PmbA family protein [Chloroflexota bacterium]
MLGERKIKKMINVILAASPAEQTEVLCIAGQGGLTRFANSAINQNVANENIIFQVRCANGKRVGRVFVNGMETAKLREAVRDCHEMTLKMEEDPVFPGFPEAPDEPYPKVSGFSEATNLMTPMDRGNAVLELVKITEDEGLTVFGALWNQTLEISIANSVGVYGYHPLTAASMRVVSSFKGMTGYAEKSSSSIENITVEELASEAIESCRYMGELEEIPPGEYDLVMEEYGVAEYLHFLCYDAFSAQAAQEGRSFLSEHIGEKVVGKNISISDDPLTGEGLPMPFDYEGVPHRTLTLIEEGVAKNLVYDTYYAAKGNTKSTGNACFPNPEFGAPLAANMTVMAGNSSLEEMIRKTEDGLYVKRLHYLREAHPKKTIITGMTRDGLYLIKNGEITARLKNMRFTQSIAESLNHVAAIGKNRKLLAEQDEFTGIAISSLVPAMKFRKFNFTGKTTF